MMIVSEKKKKFFIKSITDYFQGTCSPCIFIKIMLLKIKMAIIMGKAYNIYSIKNIHYLQL